MLSQVHGDFCDSASENGQFVNFTSEMAYSGLDLCMKFR